MHLLKHHDHVALGGVGRIVGVSFWSEIKGAVRHLERAERTRVAPITEAEARQILASACPCWGMEHRMGVCPLGLTHRLDEHEAKNTVTTALKKSVIDQMAGVASPTNLLITRIAAGTSSAATDAGATTLGAEAYRDAPTSLRAATSTQVQTFWYYGPGVANTGSLLHEWGIFGGGATATANSGTMLARFLSTFDKNIGTAASGQYTFNAN